MADLRTLKDEAADLAARGKLGKAADLYREALAADPRDVAARQKLAEVLRRAGRTAEAIEAYRALAERFARDGLLIKAIAISRTVLELDPEHVETQATLAALYARRAAADGGRAGAPPAGAARARPPPPPAPVEHERAAPVPLRPPPDAEPTPPTAFARIVRAAEDAARAGVEERVVFEPDLLEVDAPGGEIALAAAPAPRADAAAPPEPGVLPRVPIFSDLSPEAFVALARATTLRHVAAGEAVIVEGDDGTSFYVVVTGTLAVSRRDDRGDRVVVARLGEGEFFGEMALLSGARRAATVEAETPCELLELGAEVLLALAARYPHLAESLRRFYRRRLLANALAVSPVFRPFPPSDRRRLMGRFLGREVRAGEVVIREGEAADGLYVVLDGAVDVVKRKAGTQVVVGRLREGDVFGEMSCLGKAPASATVVVRRPGTLLRLPRAEFDDLVVSYPQILELVAELAEERTEHLDAILAGSARWTEDGLVLV